VKKILFIISFIFSVFYLFSSTIVILPFDSKLMADNKNTEKIFDNFSDIFIEKFLDKHNVIAGDKIIRILKKLNLDNITEFEDEDISKIIEETKADYIIIGSVTRKKRNGN